MSIDLDLVHDYMNGEEGPAQELLVARSILEEAIASEIGKSDQVVLVGRPRRRRKRSTGRRTRWSIGVLAAFAASCILIVLVLPSSKIGTPLAAAAQIGRLADSVEPAPQPQAGQWSSYQMRGELAVEVTEAGNTPTPDVKAAIPIGLRVWSNSTGTTCTSQQFGTAQFASPANAEAWHSIGLIDTPTDQPVSNCTAGVEVSAGAGSTMTAMDVSTLTHDPATLAKQLQAGTTGISSVDRTGIGESAHMAGFVRLTVLLVGPTTGGWSGFAQEMLRTMALLPGVISLGHATSHSGHTGLAFSTEQQATLNPRTGAVIPPWSGPTVILDSRTGTLLEARNFSIPVLQNAAQDFVGSPSAPVYSGVGYGINTEWIDPVGGTSIIGQGDVPTWISTFHVIEAITKSATTGEEESTVLDPFLGDGNSAFSDPDVPGAGQTTFDITIRGTAAEAESIADALTASGLFDSVAVKA